MYRWYWSGQCFEVSGVCSRSPTEFNVEPNTNTDMQMSLHLLVILTGTNWALVLPSSLYYGNNRVTIGKINHGSSTTRKNKYFLLWSCPKARTDCGKFGI